MAFALRASDEKKGCAMATHTPLPDVTLALAVIASSSAPLLLLDGDLTVIAASASFCDAFQFEPSSVPGKELFVLGAGEWNVPQLRSLLRATVNGQAEIAAYEMDLKSDRQGTRRLVLNAHKLDYADALNTRLMLTVADVTDARLTEKIKDDLLREKAILLQEIQHRVANSLQIIASVLMQSARRVQSAETRGHLQDAHSRVMSIASVQHQLAASSLSDVKLRTYFEQLCASLGASMIRDHDQITLEVTADGSSVTADASISLGLIVTELVINALKHAFPGDRKGRISVDYQSNDGDWTLSVHDTGIGMGPKHLATKAGLGTIIVEALSKTLLAHVDITDAKPGTTVSIIHNRAALSTEEPHVVPFHRVV
jgi:two-component sensor histidine kinase